MTSTITYLIMAIVVLSLIQPNAHRLVAAAIFSTVLVCFDIIFGDFDGFLYYGGAALSNFLIVFLTSFISPSSKMILRLQKTCMFMMIANLVGYLLWVFYYPPFLYDLTFAVLFCFSIYTLLDRDRWFYVGGFSSYSWSSCFSISNFKMFRNDKNYRKEG
jgi:hypothetical protein